MCRRRDIGPPTRSRVTDRPQLGWCTTVQSRWRELGSCWCFQQLALGNPNELVQCRLAQSDCLGTCPESGCTLSRAGGCSANGGKRALPKPLIASGRCHILTRCEAAALGTCECEVVNGSFSSTGRTGNGVCRPRPLQGRIDRLLRRPRSPKSHCCNTVAHAAAAWVLPLAPSASPSSSATQHAQHFLPVNLGRILWVRRCMQAIVNIIGCCCIGQPTNRPLSLRIHCLPVGMECRPGRRI